MFRNVWCGKPSRNSAYSFLSSANKMKKRIYATTNLIVSWAEWRWHLYSLKPSTVHIYIFHTQWTNCWPIRTAGKILWSCRWTRTQNTKRLLFLLFHSNAFIGIIMWTKHMNWREKMCARIKRQHKTKIVQLNWTERSLETGSWCAFVPGHKEVQTHLHKVMVHSRLFDSRENRFM